MFPESFANRGFSCGQISHHQSTRRVHPSLIALLLALTSWVMNAAKVLAGEMKRFFVTAESHNPCLCTLINLHVASKQRVSQIVPFPQRFLQKKKVELNSWKWESGKVWNCVFVFKGNMQKNQAKHSGEILPEKPLPLSSSSYITVSLTIQHQTSVGAQPEASWILTP